MKFFNSVLVGSVQDLNSEHLIKLILKDKNDDKTDSVNGITIHNWRLNNKYYSADISLCTVECRNDLPNEFTESVHVLIIYFNPSQDGYMKDIKKWEEITQSWNISEKILVCNTTSDLFDTQTDEINEWCMKHSYELVELESTDDKGDFFNENVGIDRMIEILHTCPWRNVVFKETKQTIACSRETEKNEKPSTSIDPSSEILPGMNESSESDFNDKEFENIEELTGLFENLQSMKKEISTLGANERLERAEKVVKAFWNAMGGDANEFSDDGDST